MTSLSMCFAKNAISSGRSANTALNTYFNISSANFALSAKSANANSGSTIQNSAK